MSLSSPTDAQALRNAKKLEVHRVPAPFARIVDTGAEGHTLVTFDGHEHAVFSKIRASHRVAELTDFPLPGGRDISLLLRPVNPWEPGGTAIIVHADGSESRLAPSIELFSVFVPGRASRGFLGVSSGMMHGYLELEGETYVMSTGEGRDRPLAISNARMFGSGRDLEGLTGSELVNPDWCEWVPPATEDPHDGPYDQDESAEDALGPPKLRVLESFIDLGAKIRRVFSSDQDAVDYATLLIGTSSEIYRRDAGMQLTIPNGYLRIWNGTNPWEAQPGGYPGWFNSPKNPLQGIARDWVGRLNPVPINSSASGFSACKDDAFMHAGVRGYFPYPVKHQSTNNWDLYTFGMESGHVFGSGHTHDYFPPIPCDDGSGPDKGTLMSYCPFPSGLWGIGPGFVEVIGMRYHSRVQSRFRNKMSKYGCVATHIIRRGDYDDNGVIDPADLAEFDAYQLQGFASLGALKTFDMNLDGIADAIDRALLVGMIVAPATSAIHNGTGANCLCYGPVTQPVIGQTWSAIVGPYVGSPILTIVIGAVDRMSPPLSLRAGELLIAPSFFGGQTVFLSAQMTDGFSATHSSLIPYDASLVGQKFETQAVLCKPTGAELTNAMTVNPSTY